jgi:hypothetical protein
MLQKHVRGVSGIDGVQLSTAFCSLGVVIADIKHVKS